MLQQLPGYQVDGTYNEVVGKSGGAETEKNDERLGKSSLVFIPGKSTTNAIFALRILAEKYREKQRELHCVFIDLEKAYDRVPEGRSVAVSERKRECQKRWSGLCRTCIEEV